jgi:hypothetical protein
MRAVAARPTIAKMELSSAPGIARAGGCFAYLIENAALDGGDVCDDRAASTRQSGRVV